MLSHVLLLLTEVVLDHSKFLTAPNSGGSIRSQVSHYHLGGSMLFQVSYSLSLLLLCIMLDISLLLTGLPSFYFRHFTFAYTSGSVSSKSPTSAHNCGFVLSHLFHCCSQGWFCMISSSSMSLTGMTVCLFSSLTDNNHGFSALRCSPTVH